MLLQQIVALFDGELERLTQLREIVSDLAGPSVLELPTAEEPAAAQPLDLLTAAAPPTVKAKPRRANPAAKERSVTTPRARAQAEATALNGVIPKAPVVVTAEALAKETVRGRIPARADAPPPPQPGSLGSMIRALRLEPN